MKSLNEEITKDTNEINVKKEKKDNSKLKKRLIYFISMFFVFAFISTILGIKIYDVTYCRSIYVENTGMYPTINKEFTNSDGQRVSGITKERFEGGDTIEWCTYNPNIQLNEYKRFDIVVINHTDMIRLIGFPGEVVEYKDTALFINGTQVEEKFIPADLKQYNNNCKRILGDGSYFCAYDNRTFEENDTRYNRLFKREELTGKVIKVSGTGTIKGINLINRHFIFPRYF